MESSHGGLDRIVFGPHRLQRFVSWIPYAAVHKFQGATAVDCASKIGGEPRNTSTCSKILKD